MRESNIMRHSVGNSHCLFATLLPAVHTPPTAQFLSDLASHRCKFTYATENGKVSLEGPHSEIDAYGGLAILSELQVSCGNRLADSGQGELAGIFQDFCFEHFWLKARPLAPQTSLLHRLMSQLLEACPQMEAYTIGVAVSMENRNSIESQTKWGNGFVITTMSAKTLRSYDASTPADFREAMRLRAVRTLRIMQTGRMTTPSERQIVFSSVGDLGRYAMVPNLNPSELVMVPTPARGDAANVVLWHKDGIQGLTVVASQGHFLFSHAPATWRDLLAKEQAND